MAFSPSSKDGTIRTPPVPNSPPINVEESSSFAEKGCVPLGFSRAQKPHLLLSTVCLGTALMSSRRTPRNEVFTSAPGSTPVRESEKMTVPSLGARSTGAERNSAGSSLGEAMLSPPATYFHADSSSSKADSLHQSSVVENEKASSMPQTL